MQHVTLIDFYFCGDIMNMFKVSKFDDKGEMSFKIEVDLHAWCEFDSAEKTRLFQMG